MDSVLQLVKSLDPMSQGAVAFLAVLGVFATKLFPDGTPVRVRLVVFFTLVCFAGGGLVYSGRNARLQQDKADPHETAGVPHAVSSIVGSLLEGLDPMGVAHAADAEGWIFVGKFDEAAGRWVEGPAVTLPDAARVPGPGQHLRTVGSTPIYDDQPRFSIFTQSWKLGAKKSEVGGGVAFGVQGKPVFVGQNVWCRVSPR
jgi:hypothetical protein